MPLKIVKCQIIFKQFILQFLLAFHLFQIYYFKIAIMLIFKMYMNS